MYTREEVLAAMSAKGFPLSGYEDAHCDIPTEDLILAIIGLGHPRCYEGVPIIVDRSPPDFQSLLEKAVSEGVQNQVGFLLEGCLFVLARHRKRDYPELENVLNILHAQRSETVQKMMRLDSPYEDEMLARNMEDEHCRWRVMGASSYAQMDLQFRVYDTGRPLNERFPPGYRYT